MEENLNRTFNRLYVRPSTDVEFYQDSEEFTQYMVSTYVDTGKCLQFRKQTFLDDAQLKLQIESIWLNDTYYQEADNDPNLLENFFITSNYCLSKNILMI